MSAPWLSELGHRSRHADFADSLSGYSL